MYYYVISFKITIAPLVINHTFYPGSYYVGVVGDTSFPGDGPLYKCVGDFSLRLDRRDATHNLPTAYGLCKTGIEWD